MLTVGLVCRNVKSSLMLEPSFVIARVVLLHFHVCEVHVALMLSGLYEALYLRACFAAIQYRLLESMSYQLAPSRSLNLCLSLDWI